jgi:thiol-disulfide isomerase/thioredoxin
MLVLLISVNAHSQEVRVGNFAELEKEFQNHPDSIIIVNFWATWCRPCVEEMKYFIEAQEKYKKSNVVFVYVSLDMAKDKEKVEQFVTKKGLKGAFYILKDDPNVYINKIDKSWEGEIPFTLIIKKDKKYSTHSAAFTSFQELDEYIKINSK